MKTPKIKNWDLETWNNLNPVSSPCIYTDDFGVEHRTITRSVAWKLGHGQAVVSIEGRSGGHDLERIKILETHHAR